MLFRDNVQKPEFWVFDQGSVAQEWGHFWRDCIVCVPCWDNVGRDQNSAANTAGSGNPGVQVMGRWGNRLSTGYFTAGSCQGSGSGFPIPSTSFCKGGKSYFTPAFASTCDALIGTYLGNDIVPAGQMTMLMVRQRDSASITNASSIGINAANPVNRASTHCPYTDSTVYFDFGGFTNGATRVSFAYTPTTNVEAWAFVAGKNGLAIYLDGVVRVSGGSAAARTVGTTNFGLFNAGGLLAQSDANHMLFFALLDTEWTAGQVAEWASDPYGPIRMVEPPPAAALTPIARNPTKFYMRR